MNFPNNRKVNYRYRGPIENNKIGNMYKATKTDINKLYTIYNALINSQYTFLSNLQNNNRNINTIINTQIEDVKQLES
jgi:hypothetical protein